MSTGTTGAPLGGVEVKKSNPLKAVFPYLVVVLCLVISFIVFYTVFNLHALDRRSPDQLLRYCIQRRFRNSDRYGPEPDGLGILH